MLTQSEQNLAASAIEPQQWTARIDAPRRSVFGNYAPATAAGAGQSAARCGECGTPGAVGSLDQLRLQSAIDSAMARAFLYQYLARSFDDPALESWRWFTDSATRDAFLSAVRALATQSPSLELSAATLLRVLPSDNFDSFQCAYVTAFGHAARGDCPLNEIEYGDLNADPLFQPHRLADLAGFYRAFGMEVAGDATERPDHIGIELEFMCLLAAREAYAFEHQLDDTEVALNYDAQKKFLREHLGRWTPAFARRLARAATAPVLVVVAEFLRDFITVECARFGLPAGSEDLLLRPVDAAAEQLCSSCGLQNLPPGAHSPQA